MAKTDLNSIKQWFKNGLKPTQEQFWAWLDSYWHKDDKIPAENIQGLNEMLSGIDLSSKVENADFESFQSTNTEELNKKANANADNIADNVAEWQTALSIYTKETAKKELGEKVDKEDGKGLSTNDFTNEYKAVLDNLPVELSTETTIKFDRDRDYGTRGRPLDTFTLDLTNAKRGVVNVIFFNGSVLPSPSGVDYGNSRTLFRAGTTQKIAMLFVDNSTILANILS
ncbi:hypothetical protein ACQ1Q1_00935 [Ornithobacterium rhinotracheale]|uniref:hypothetical protein n=1 Tax=Ornithobacterium rhinotracheale TaxID=28251 RepID=UPI004036E230